MSDPAGDGNDDGDSLLHSPDSLSPRSAPRSGAVGLAVLCDRTGRDRHCRSGIGLCCTVVATVALLSLVLLAIRPLTLSYDRRLSTGCRGVDSERLFLPAASARSPIHCPAYSPLHGGGGNESVQIHFVYGMEANTAATNFTFLSYLAMLSAYHHHKPDVTVHVHHHYPLAGDWFQLLQSVLGSALQLHEVADVTSIFGRPVSHYAHKADIVRLEALRKYGGVYLDADVITIRPLHPLLSYTTVLAEEPIGPGLLNYAVTLFVDGHGSTPERMRGVDGLANAVIFAHADSPFIESWYGRYRTFDSSSWDYHSCKLPLLMASEPLTQLDPPSAATDLLTLSVYAFFHPQYDTLSHFFHSADADLTRNFGVHFAHLHTRLGQSDYHRFVGGVSSVEEGLKRNRDNNFGRIIRGLLYGEVTW